MLKAVFLDLDETLCDTTGANQQALKKMAELAVSLDARIDATAFADAYLAGIYRNYPSSYKDKVEPIGDEGEFRLKLIKLILSDLGVTGLSDEQVVSLQQCFDTSRELAFDFFPGIKAWLQRLRQHLTLVVITNGPEFSQVAKVNAVNLEKYVDHIIIGGQEPEQKPAKSIFDKAMALANCSADECIHIGDSLSADIQGAENAGIHSIWVRGEQDPVAAADYNPSDVIHSPLELSSHFESICKRLF